MLDPRQSIEGICQHRESAVHAGRHHHLLKEQRRTHIITSPQLTALTEQNVEVLDCIVHTALPTPRDLISAAKNKLLEQLSGIEQRA
ncbi:hypothetical protein GCM10008957_42330 [Deinococcus ruber]|uniref:Uncharacterized protein n=1 Tax=Deinococcus ruber TaxID=1848197 RepID=A0A918CJH6_9DEIO|nr:hypothetical protein GCM10008957_42330 [Deinococcus ruber]